LNYPELTPLSSEEILIVAFYLASDVHMRMDRPQRAGRFARWVRQLEDGASLLIAGDLCDFWMVSRQSEQEMLDSEGLAALVGFRARGGSLAILPGNHDFWICPFYERSLGAVVLREPYETTIHGIRLHLVHGHLLGARRKWKSWMESREFKTAFELLPGPVAGLFDQLLERRNNSGLDADERRHLAVFRTYTAGLRGVADIVVIGHVHRAVDDAASDPRMIVLGGWQERSSYLKIDSSGASFHVVADQHQEDWSPAVASQGSSSSAPSCPIS
jgi:UDP-2,3-diacylglucosamine hydrolase